MLASAEPITFFEAQAPVFSLRLSWTQQKFPHFQSLSKNDHVLLPSVSSRLVRKDCRSIARVLVMFRALHDATAKRLDRWSVSAVFSSTRSSICSLEPPTSIPINCASIVSWVTCLAAFSIFECCSVFFCPRPRFLERRGEFPRPNRQERVWTMPSLTHGSTSPLHQLNIPPTGLSRAYASRGVAYEHTRLTGCISAPSGSLDSAEPYMKGCGWRACRRLRTSRGRWEGGWKMGVAQTAGVVQHMSPWSISTNSLHGHRTTRINSSFSLTKIETIALTESSESNWDADRRIFDFISLHSLSRVAPTANLLSGPSRADYTSSRAVACQCLKQNAMQLEPPSASQRQLERSPETAATEPKPECFESNHVLSNTFSLPRPETQRTPAVSTCCGHASHGPPRHPLHTRKGRWKKETICKTGGFALPKRLQR